MCRTPLPMVQDPPADAFPRLAMMPDNQEHEALAEAERELRRISTIVDDEDTERPDEREALEVIEGLFRAGLWHAKMSMFEQERLIERTERVLQRHGRKLPTGAMRDIERPAQSDVCGVRGCMRVPGHESSHSIEDGW